MLEQIEKVDQDLIDALRPYFESAHLDAREHFHAQIGISLHPDAAVGPPCVSYPNCLPAKAHRGLFGEVVAGLVTQAYQDNFVGGHAWQVPIFLFRQHDDVENYLWALRWNPARKREIYGRHGSDFIGIAVNSAGEVVRVIAGEAKWRKRLQPAVVANLMLGDKERNAAGVLVHNGRGIWFEINRDSPIPHGLRQLQRLLEQRDPNGHAAAILSIDRAVLGLAAPFARTNLVLIAGNASANREARTSVIPWDELPEEYTSAHDLQVVEVILSGDGDDLIDGLYNTLWQNC
ncbi:aminotransferase [Caulobacter segnis]|uniref:aminotransferase n=1 Tax=Caulobacter segnis TaxID=88688 RepID=UPI0026EF032C|nr:aminotransferase [Caulobacter segnis]